MANHIRTQIRARLATLLSGLATTGSRVYTSQYYALAPADLPGLVIYTPEDDTSTPPPNCHPGTLRHVINVTIEAVVTGTGNLADALDQIAKEVEAAMATDFTLAGTVKEIRLMRSTFTARGGDSPQPGGTLVMQWEAVTSTREGVSDVGT